MIISKLSVVNDLEHCLLLANRVDFLLIFFFSNMVFFFDTPQRHPVFQASRKQLRIWLLISWRKRPKFQEHSQRCTQSFFLLEHDMMYYYHTHAHQTSNPPGWWQGPGSCRLRRRGHVGGGGYYSIWYYHHPIHPPPQTSCNTGQQSWLLLLNFPISPFTQKPALDRRSRKRRCGRHWAVHWMLCWTSGQRLWMLKGQAHWDMSRASLRFEKDS